MTFEFKLVNISLMEARTNKFELDLLYVAGYDEVWGSMLATVFSGDELSNKTLIDALRVDRLETTPTRQVMHFQTQNLSIESLVTLKLTLEQNTTCVERAHKRGLRFSLLGLRLKYQS